MRVRAICCEIIFREACLVAANSPLIVDFDFLRKGLHNLGSDKMRTEIQKAVDAVDPERYEATLLGYALCGNGIGGLTARTLPVVVPRAHDCITLFLGSRQRYLDYFNSHPGVYFKTTGWIERGKNLHMLDRQMTFSYDELVAKYGEDDARYLYEELTKHYRQFTYIEMGVEPDGSFEREAREEATQRGWAFEKVQGDLRLFRGLVDGKWEEQDFLVVQPGQRIVVKLDNGIIAAENA